MIISHSKRFVFLRNPKAGSTSVIQALSPYADSTYLYRGFTPNGDLQDIAHLRKDQWSTEIISARKEGYKTFGIVRDPIRRFESAVNEFYRQYGDLVSATGLPIGTFLEYFLHPGAAKYDLRYVHFCPQWTYFADHNPFNVGFRLSADIRILPLEETDTRWLDLCEWLDIERVPLPSIRSSLGYELNYRVTESILPLLKILYSRDFEFLESAGFGGLYGESRDRILSAVDPSVLYPYGGMNSRVLDALHYDREVATPRIQNLIDKKTNNDERRGWWVKALTQTTTVLK